MLPKEIFEQLMLMQGEPTPDAMGQNKSTFIAAYNPKDPLKLLFKCCADCQEIAIVARVPYMAEQLLVLSKIAGCAACAPMLSLLPTMCLWMTALT